MRNFIRNSRKFVYSWFEHKKHDTDRTDPIDLKKEESSLLYLYSKVFLLLFRTRLENAMRIAPYFPDLGSIVIRFVFSDYETVAGREVSVKSLARTRNCCYIFCIYFRRHFDKTSRCVPIKFAWTVDLSTKRERKRILLWSSFHAKKILSASSRFLEPNRIERSSPIACWSLVIDVAATVETKGGE